MYTCGNIISLTIIYIEIKKSKNTTDVLHPICCISTFSKRTIQYKGNNDKGKASNELTNKAENPYLTNKENPCL